VVHRPERALRSVRHPTKLKQTNVIARSAATKQALRDCRYVKRLGDRRRPVAGPAGALRASKIAPGDIVASLAMTLVPLKSCFRTRPHSSPQTFPDAEPLRYAFLVDRNPSWVNVSSVSASLMARKSRVTRVTISESAHFQLKISFLFGTTFS